MGYTIIDSQTGRPLPLRIISDWQRETNGWAMFQIGNEFQPKQWVNDACNRSEERYWVEFENGSSQTYPWWQIIEPGDTFHDVQVKLAHAAAVRQAAIELSQAKMKYKRLTGMDAPENCRRIILPEVE